MEESSLGFNDSSGWSLARERLYGSNDSSFWPPLYDDMRNSSNESEVFNATDAVAGLHRSLAATIFSGIAMGIIIVFAILGNLLVIVSVFRHKKLRLITNIFVVSLSVADILVAIMAMTFNASVELTGKWLFNHMVCNLWNSFDMYASTVSILHLCCISVDRHIAVIKPLQYPMLMTKRVVAYTLLIIWVLPLAISFAPIYAEIYTTDENLLYMKTHPDECRFVVNKFFCVISSTLSFWGPCSVMLYMYYHIYQEASRQERFQHRNARHSVASTTHLASSDGISAVANKFPIESRPPSTNNGSSRKDKLCVVKSNQLLEIPTPDNGRRLVHRTSTDANDCSPAREFVKMKREYKAARTLGIIMGAFITCWLPFFSWYVIATLCGSDTCPVPDLVVTVLFWIGYFNSMANPGIYAYFNRDFREAFRITLTDCFCVCCRKKDNDLGWNSNAGGPYDSDVQLQHNGNTVTRARPPGIRINNHSEI